MNNIKHELIYYAHKNCIYTLVLKVLTNEN